MAVCRAHGNVTVINADTNLDNIGSQRVLEKNGFHKVRSSDTLHYYAPGVLGRNAYMRGALAPVYQR